ncbi:MAG: coproporphyrinogen dehydrogenase HemZ [Ruminococcaceae bacterium]|nr:coproporphyrinogen dehydrogenase HemZ [Oscillospiraceae bacterium]
MIIKNINHDCSYQTEKIALTFFPLEKLNEGDNVVIITALENGTVSADVKLCSKTLSKKRILKQNEDIAHAISLLLYEALSELTHFKPPWGILYGVRPARLMHSRVEKFGKEKALELFRSDLTDEKKIALAFEVMERENKIISLSRDDSFSLYVSIPFCPSRCSYCSFVSHSIENAGDLIQPYVNLLCKELEEIGSIAQMLNLNLETIYFGGGTPTTLSASQLDEVLSAVERSFDLSNLRELTVEAGRPDTITEEKLNSLLNHNVQRISINAQSFNDEVLKAIGRKHSVKQTLDAFELAKKLGFKNINTDLIAGLNTDSLESFENSVDTAISLGAQSVTVHNLSLKSGAYLVTENEYFDTARKLETSFMIDFAYQKLKSKGYNPYYMYRQSKSLGNLENTGYAKEGFECLYNIFMMDETHSVFAAGAGAVTKLKKGSYNNIERIYNYKYPYEYINNFEEVIARKQQIIDYYNL